MAALSLFKQYNVNFHRGILMFLRSTPANTVFNNFPLKVGRNSFNIRGFIGVESDTSKVIKGAFCWGHGNSLETIVFRINPTNRGRPLISFPSSPVGWNGTKNGKYLRAFLEAALPKLSKRWVDKNLFPSSSGGRYSGLRLEAHKRTRTRPNDRFAMSPNLFSQAFINATVSLNVTYK